MIRIAIWVDPVVEAAVSRLGMAHWSIASAQGYDGFLDAVSSHRFDVALVDLHKRPSPPGKPASETERFDTTLRSLPVPLVVLADETIDSLRVTIALSRRRSVELALLRDDGTLEGISDAIEAAAATRLGRQILSRLALARPMISKSRIWHILERLFLHPRDFGDEPAALMREQISATSINERLRACNLCSLRILRRAARVAAAYQLTRAHGLPGKQVAAFVGCGSVDTLEREVERATGRSLARLATVTFEAEIVDVVVRSCIVERARREAV